MGARELARATVWALVAGSLACSPPGGDGGGAQAGEEPAGSRPQSATAAVEDFRPYPDRALRLINAFAFVPGADQVVFALLHREASAHLTGQATTDGPEVSLYTAALAGGEWGPPELLTLSGRFHDYEPTVSTDGRWMVFNSRRPGPDGSVPELNDLWLAERSGDGWAEPRRIHELDTVENEESYASFGPNGTLVFHGRVETEAGPQSDLYITRLEDGVFSPPVALADVNSELGEGDPWLAADGSYLLFTRWDEVSWAETSDLWVTFADGDGWTEPVPVTSVNSDGADYAPTVSPDGRTLYVRVGGPYTRRPLAPVLDEARRAAGLGG